MCKEAMSSIHEVHIIYRTMYTSEGNKLEIT